MTEILILDFNRENELRDLLFSLKVNALFDKKITILNNGGERYADSFKEEGLLSDQDEVINNTTNVGCGAGTIQLFAQCKSKYAFYIQVDHLLYTKITQKEIEEFENLLQKYKISHIDLSGDQGHGKYSERAQFISVDFYNSIPKSIGGPGPWDHIKWTEQCVQENIEERGLSYISVTYEIGSQKVPPFIDRGKWSIRTNPDGSMWKHRTDTKQLICLKTPKEKYSFPPLSDEQWEKAISGNWPENGEVPFGWKDHVFKYWED
jgi:hypothetical protein